MLSTPIDLFLTSLVAISTYRAFLTKLILVLCPYNKNFIYKIFLTNNSTPKPLSGIIYKLILIEQNQISS